MNEHQKYLLQEKYKHDKQQFILSTSGIQTNPHHQAKQTITITDKNVFCPFCLAKQKLSKFTVSTKKGINKRLGKCPQCNNQMLFETLIRMLQWTPKDYAEFVYKYPSGAFFSKCKFQTWKQRLYDLDMSYEFWQTYKQLKEEYTEYDKFKYGDVSTEYTDEEWQKYEEKYQ